MNSKSFSIKKGKLKVSDNLEFMKIFRDNTPENADAYKKLTEYGKKIIRTYASDIPMNEAGLLINRAITKAMNNFNPEKKTNFLTHLTNWIRSEITLYRNRRDSMQKKIKKLGDAFQDTYGVGYDKEGNQEIIALENGTPEEELITGDVYRRQMIAFRMAFSQLPYYSQRILYLTAKGYTYLQLADMLNDTEKNIMKARNAALSLLLSIVLLSKHLDDEEKKEILEELGLAEENE